jgi:hypothetical protein
MAAGRAKEDEGQTRFGGDDRDSRATFAFGRESAGTESAMRLH